MNRSEYLISLYDALKDMPTEKRNEVINEYKEYFRIESEKGRTDDEISLSLGDPATLAYAIKNRSGYAPNQQFNSMSGNFPPRRRKRRGGKIALTIIIFIIILSIVTGISIGGNIISSILSSFSLGFGKAYDVNETEEINWSNADKIDIIVTSTDTRVLESSGDKVKAELKGTIRTTDPNVIPTIELSQSGNVITIREKRKAITTFFTSSDIVLNITIPKDFSGDLLYKGTSGNFSASDLRLNSLALSITSGDTRLERIETKKDTIIKCTSGESELYDIKCDEASINCTSGDILIDLINSDYTSVKSLSGEIDVKDFSGAITLQTTSGDITATANDPEKEINISATSGNIRLGLPENEGFELFSRATSGDINCEFDLDKSSSSEHKLEGKSGNGEIPITIKATSGNIKISKN